MADFLDINGVPVSVADQSFTNGVIDIGDRDRAVDGSLIQTRVTLKQKYTWTTAQMLPADGVAWRAFINGYGHHWSFDTSVYSGKGLGPSGPSSLYVQNGSGGKYGGLLQVDTNAAGGVFQVTPTGLDAIVNSAPQFNFTVMFWAREQNGSTWDHYIIIFPTSGGSTIYKNGVLGGADGVTGSFTESTGGWFEFMGYGYNANGRVAIPTWLGTHTYAANAFVQPTAGHANGRYYQVTAGGGGNSGSVEPTWPTVLGNTVVDGAITWTDRGPSSLYIDDLVVLPFTVPQGPVPASNWISALYTFASTQALPDNPQLYVSGLGVLNAGNMIGSVGDTKLIQGVLGGAFTQNLVTVGFTLEEA